MTLTVPVESERLARRIAAQSGRTPEDVVRDVIEREARLVGIGTSDRSLTMGRADVDGAEAIARRIASRPLLDPRPAARICDEIWGDLDGGDR